MDYICVKYITIGMIYMNIRSTTKAVLRVDASKKKFHIHKETLGANMEDLHYQMSGG